jgi:hypothetical protein
VNQTVKIHITARKDQCKNNWLTNWLFTNFFTKYITINS